MSQIFVLTKDELDKAIEHVISKFQNKEIQISVDSINDRLSQKEAADFLGITVQNLIKWKKRRKIPYYQIEDTVFFSKKEILDHARKDPTIVKNK